MATYCLGNFVNDPSPNDRLIFIYNCSGVLVMSIDPYASTFFKKDKYVYIVTDGRYDYNNALDFDSESTSDSAVARLNHVKKIFIDRTNNILGCTTFATTTEFGIHTATTNAHQVSFENLIDSSITNPQDGQIIIYSGNTWVNTNAVDLDWSNIQNTPTTLSGYGITDAYTINEIDILISGTTQDISAHTSLTGSTNPHITSFFDLTSTAHTHITEDVFFNKLEPTAIVVGGIIAGTNLSGKSVYEIFDMMMFPELFPTLTNPSNSFSMSITGFREVGELISTISFSSTFGRGSISPSYGTSGYRSGLPNQYNYTGIDLINNPSTLLSDGQSISNYTVLLGTQSWTGSVSYDVGEQPLSSKGNNYSSPLGAGSTSNITRSIIGVYPYFATTVGISILTKQILTSHGTTVTTSMVVENGIDKQSVEFPLLWGTITILQQYNTLSGLWDNIDLNSFTITDVTNTINGNIIDYKKYTHNGGLIGARQLRWRVS